MDIGERGTWDGLEGKCPQQIHREVYRSLGRHGAISGLAPCGTFGRPDLFTHRGRLSGRTQHREAADRITRRHERTIGGMHVSRVGDTEFSLGGGVPVGFYSVDRKTLDAGDLGP